LLVTKRLPSTNSETNRLMARGDIFLTDIPYPQGAPGREQAGRRPAIVVQADNPTTPTPTVIVIPATSNVARAQYPLHAPGATLSDEWSQRVLRPSHFSVARD
ncbi:MAG TPA: type II toxin-antitoxin system PemK/MazF family toxin, partial [Ardenticatenaceae bacterium]